MNEQDVNKRFDDLVQPKIIQQIIKPKREPSKFPELRYLWGVALLGSFVLIVLASVAETIITSLR